MRQIALIILCILAPDRESQVASRSAESLNATLVMVACIAGGCCGNSSSAQALLLSRSDRNRNEDREARSMLVKKQRRWR
jgi:hypothetical protein